ncbi:MAG: Hvo_1808 family surface protein [Halodesulfurarchaeum sp.]
MWRRGGKSIVLVVVVVLAGCSGVPVLDTPSVDSSGGASPTTDPVAGPTVEPGVDVPQTDMVADHPDPPSDRLGWENGYWHNETIPVDPEDGYNESELDAILARSMARVEYVRGIEFEENVTVDVITREEYRERIADRGSNITDNQRLHQEVKFEATFFMGENESALRQREANAGSNVLGFYSSANESITIVSDDSTVSRIDEMTLAHELVHALQDSRFNISDYEQNTEERHNAIDGIVEGDAKYVEFRYGKLCEAGWECLAESQSQSGGDDDAPTPHLGLLALQLQPYSDGPVFVHHLYQENGWEGVNAAYDDPPASTEQTIHPEKYGVDEPTNVTIDDRSDPDWYVPDQGEGHIDYAQFGEAGLYVMLWYPSGVRGDVVISSEHFLGPSRSGGLDLYNYSHPYTAGWDGDKLLPYVRNDSAETNQTGYVWRSTWDSRDDAKEFREGYLKLLRHHGAEDVRDRPDTYRIPSGPFADAFYVEQTGNNVTIVNAPTVEELGAVRAGAGEST